jgi:DNA primase
MEIHVPPVRLGRGGEPRVDQLVLDLDPMPPAGWRETQRAARGVRRLLDAAGVASYPKLSGQTGLHVFVPVAARPGGLTTAAIARGVAMLLWRAAPDVYTVAWPVRNRRGVYVDHTQNAGGHTMAAAYSPRPSDGARVSAPVRWDEVAEVSPGLFTIHTSLWSDFETGQDIRIQGLVIWHPVGLPILLNACLILFRGHVYSP